uniref:hypothetical protein n=1 Tax=Serratia proteamaculans TaxID=28151 RepID=UPI001F4C4037|nr:hypothetical protein [Serratia proteamaculans]ULG13599.1 hypothetical protein 1Ap1_00106 [Serratia proteamaculans]ULG13712.1 hypothetical protein 4p_00016 [Serratia proteamaculans]ULG15163.1 hypothetical protein 163p1_00008 [Serratia proteamaculans]ULG16399.1 hypothetical protein 1129p_00036 [Serratia proteamaculans]ULG19471.1 hypothetical protein SpFp1_00100 [Serratia proteamaculans]
MNIKKTLFYTLLSLVIMVLVIAGVIFSVAYYRIGAFDQSSQNLATCQGYSNQEAKNKVLDVYLKNNTTNKETGYSRKLSDRKGIKFDDATIQKTNNNWLIPFSVVKEGETIKQFGIIDCGTLQVEFSTDTGS